VGMDAWKGLDWILRDLLWL